MTKMWIMRANGETETREIDLPEAPGYEKLRDLIEPLLDGKPLEHVSVLFENRRADMFVDETGRLDGLPRNEAATLVYRAAWLSHNRYQDPEDIPSIHGTAIIFDRRVWF